MDETSPFPQQVLSQSEVENLLAQVAEEEGNVEVHTVDRRTEKFSKDSVQPYDFRHPVFLSPSELRRLRLRHEDYLRSLTARMALHLRLEIGMQMSKLQTVLYRKFTESLTNPTHITLFRVDPLPGICILEVQPRLGLTFVDRLLGGAAHSVSADHDLTEIELALLEQVVQIIIGEWCHHWRGIKELRPVLLGTESSGRFLETAAHDAVMLSLSFEVRLGDCLEQVQIGFPYNTLEPLIRALSESMDTGSKPAGEQRQAPAAVRWNPRFNDVRIPVSASWQGLEMPARDLAALQVGDVLELAPGAIDQVQIKLAGMSRFRARLGTRGRHLAVELCGPSHS
jgi:flagellar motor switch protein FliM